MSAQLSLRPAVFLRQFVTACFVVFAPFNGDGVFLDERFFFPGVALLGSLDKGGKFVEKLEEVVGLYLSPPEHALVLCCDEKSQVQTLDRTQPGLPLKKGRAATMTHDYKRNGITTLFAALNILNGTVIAQCQQRHRRDEWLKFLKKIDRETPKDKTLHLIANNYATHKHPMP